MEPITTHGHTFRRGNERFLIKGISYNLPRKRDQDSNIIDPQLDSLAESRLEGLKRDIEIFKELGLNTVQVSLDFHNKHDKAMKILAEAGIYVLVEVCQRITTLSRRGVDGSDTDTAACYTVNMMRRALRLIDELADHPNLLGFIVCGDAVLEFSRTKVAEVCRAAVRDIKAFLRVRDGRVPPVGVNVQDIMMSRMPMLEYSTAGPKDERADFFAPVCFSWAGPSNFQISGWQGLVEVMEPYPVPMFFAAYGTNVNPPRKWDEVECLYSPAMTGVFSGGCLYAYFDISGHGIVKTCEDGNVVKKEGEFDNLKKGFEIVNARTRDELFSTDVVKDYENWNGQFPQIERIWQATPNTPTLPATVEAFWEEIRKERDESVAEAANA